MAAIASEQVTKGAIEMLTLTLTVRRAYIAVNRLQKARDGGSGTR